MEKFTLASKSQKKTHKIKIRKNRFPKTGLYKVNSMQISMTMSNQIQIASMVDL